MQVPTTPPAEYMPAAQLVHCKPVLYSPASQSATTQKLARASDFEPTEQGVHVPAPPAEYVLAAQLVQLGDPVLEKRPAEHSAHSVPPTEPL